MSSSEEVIEKVLLPGGGEKLQSGAKKEPKPSSLTLRLGGTLVFVLIFSVGLSGLLTYFNFEKRHRELISSRLQVMLDEVRIGIDQGTGLGLPLNSLMETNTHLRSLRQTDPYIELAAVVTTQRQVLFRAGQMTDLGQILPDNWLQQSSTDQEPGHQSKLFMETQDYLLVAEPLFNNFDVQSGVVVLAYQREAYLMKNWALLKQQAQSSGLWMLVSVVIGLTILWLMMHRLRYVIGRMDNALLNNLSGSDQVYEVQHPQDELENQFGELHSKVREARQQKKSD